MPKLHELLAAEGSLVSQMNKTRSDLEATFVSKRHHFEEARVTFHPYEEGKVPETEKQSDLQTTVPRELTWIQGIMAPAIDAEFQIALANTIARADIVFEDGTILAKAVPATALLSLEKRLNEIHTLVSKIPTLDPAKGFSPDADRGKGIYRAREEKRGRTQKKQRPIVLYAATEHHPAQTQLISEDVEVGHTITQAWSGLLTVAEKGDMLDRVEKLRVAVKKARSRANEAAVDTETKIADRLLNFAFKAEL